MPQTVKSVEGFVRKIRGLPMAPHELLLYRGHSNRRKFRLLPSVLREQKFADAEHTIFRELMASQPSEFAGDRTVLDRLARMQHYSLPTRLLDVTANPLVALFFAAKSCGTPESPGEVILFRVARDQVKYYDSDTVSCITNLSQLTNIEKAALDFGLQQKEFNETNEVDRLLQFIREEKPYFRERIIPDDLRRVLCVKPKFNSKRIVAQSGAFLLFGMTGALDDNPAPGITVERISINGNHKTTITRELAHLGINDSTMFPEIESAARYITASLGI